MTIDGKQATKQAKYLVRKLNENIIQVLTLPNVMLLLDQPFKSHEPFSVESTSIVTCTESYKELPLMDLVLFISISVTI